MTQESGQRNGVMQQNLRWSESRGGVVAARRWCAMAVGAEPEHGGSVVGAELVDADIALHPQHLVWSVRHTGFWCLAFRLEAVYIQMASCRMQNKSTRQTTCVDADVALHPQHLRPTRCCEARDVARSVIGRRTPGQRGCGVSRLMCSGMHQTALHPT